MEATWHQGKHCRFAGLVARKLVIIDPVEICQQLLRVSIDMFPLLHLCKDDGDHFTLSRSGGRLILEAVGISLADLLMFTIYDTFSLDCFSLPLLAAPSQALELCLGRIPLHRTARCSPLCMFFAIHLLRYAHLYELQVYWRIKL